MNGRTATTPSLTAPLIAWLVIQLVALGIGAAGVPLSAKAVRPAEGLSVQIMLVTQACAAAVLWPMLFGAWRRSLVTVAAALPFTQAAGFVSATPAAELLAAGGMLLLWLGSLAALPDERLGEVGRLVVRAGAVLLSAGLGVATYLRAEFAPPQTPTPAFGPLAWTLGELPVKSGIFPWICLGGVFMVCLLARLVLNRTRRGTAA